jgi:hypothetical protein
MKVTSQASQIADFGAADTECIPIQHGSIPRTKSKDSIEMDLIADVRQLGLYLKKIDDKIQELDLVIAVLERSLVNLHRRADRQAAGLVRTHKPRIAAAVLGALETLGRPARNIEIKNFLLESGYQFTGMDEDVSIVQALNRLLDANKVRKIGRGIWVRQS